MKNESFALVLAVLILIVSIGQAAALSIDVKMLEGSESVSAGQKAYFIIQIKYPENTERKDLRISYDVLEDDAVIASNNVLRAIETQASFAEYIIVPKGAKGGLHELAVNVSDYGNLSQEVSTSFSVISEGMDKMEIYFIIIIIILALIALLVIYETVMKKRNIGPNK
jgi:hypothetical protein